MNYLHGGVPKMERIKKYLLVLIMACLPCLIECGGNFLEVTEAEKKGIDLYPGYKQTYSADGVSFNMTYVPGGLLFKTGTDDSGLATVANAYCLIRGVKPSTSVEDFSMLAGWKTIVSQAIRYTTSSII